MRGKKKYFVFLNGNDLEKAQLNYLCDTQAAVCQCPGYYVLPHLKANCAV